MFGTMQQPPPQALFSDPNRKRARDEEDDMMNGTLSFGEHRNKRLQSLPLRTSPSSKRWSTPIMPLNSKPYTLTPGDSDSEEQPRSHFSPWSSSSAAQTSCQPSPFHQDELDRDMDMMDTMSPPPVPQEHHQVHALAHQPSVNGRMPTPIQPSFAAQVRGGAWGGPGPAVTHLNGVVNMGHMHAGFSSDESRAIPRSMDADDWHSVQNRRLPSPISEGEDSTSRADSGSLSPASMVLDSGFPNQLAMRLQQSSLNGHSDTGMMDIEHAVGGMMDGDDAVTTTVDALPTETSSAPATPSPGKKGHIRSRHTVNNWTWQPGMKKSFSIGYRADCEKCRMKVPGHFNHIVVS
ncbi:hypothetical protein CTRI78_v011614 [Colletotrichum trifolii]|uniref:Uncharacterized protein n=1 Tax=Colletotrichum trifolii TaxID=5466 RepID=A0A4R8Q781_COLTR|nr:hypothetical protein CTRI78_v011614 [Colletotrichum trifolii]